MQYDLCDPSIRCNADKEGAEVFEVTVRGRIVRVLAFDERTAREIADGQRRDGGAPEQSEDFLELF